MIKGLSAVITQLDCVDRLSTALGMGRSGELESFIKSLYADLGHTHTKIEFKLNWQGSPLRLPTPVETVVLLIIAELIDNAIYAIGGSGAIETTVSFLHSSNCLRITVHDTGPGIPTDLGERVFSEGVSTKGEGRGLGLWLVREAALSLGGTVSYEQGNGATFCVTVPFR
jgi:sensor histidine kinase regulating citrate/malate metabolism